MIKLLTFLISACLVLTGCDPMLHRELVISNAYLVNNSSSVVVENSDFNNKIRIIDKILTNNGFYQVTSHEGAYKTYDKDKNPMKNRESFTFVNIVLIKERKEIKIEYTSFPAGPFGKVEVLEEISNEINK